MAHQRLIHMHIRMYIDMNQQYAPRTHPQKHTHARARTGTFTQLTSNRSLAMKISSVILFFFVFWIVFLV